jgi:hypothetical protein
MKVAQKRVQLLRVTFVFVDSVKKGIRVPSVAESCNYEHVTRIQKFGLKTDKKNTDGE